ncbi:putative GTP-binding protein EngB [Desulfamplus magnetovallimortis]|uniref:Probable GTP-binding protein EngB n=1 Tax=Desulfamplus magnetovallimortis TaxID=1246637 RepID=A0A1W1H9D6_9BACT|nr:ribosome biogenesis GTP-binding protein YihA/YsxC [Desulfamplus magnetovallimortis]SLM29063.1 putative GTP-binding protein EngB [Desulfamplus magnetovallimortis]
MIIKQAEFIKSAVNPSHFPEPEFPEVAFAGRSNVGKSSLINTLVNRKSLVKTSSRPGCTQLINFFNINSNFFFVDLPGYGYAKVSKKIRAQWGPMVERYLSVRPNLMGVLLLIDIRREPRKEEFELMQWLANRSIPALIVLTKADKLSRNKQQKQLAATASMLGCRTEDIILFSATSKQGRESVLEELGTLFSQN